MTIEPIPRTLYTHPDNLAVVCLPDGSGWVVPDPDQPRTDGGWKIFPGDMEGRSPALFDLTDDEILRLCRAEDLAATIAEIKAARHRRSSCKAAPAPKGRSTLYLTPREPAVLHESGNLWILYATGSELSPPRPVPSEWIEIAQDLTSAEVASLVDHDKRLLAIFKILSARKPAPGCDEAEVERWRKAAERAEADRRLDNERANVAEAEVERLRGIVVALAARLAGL